MREGTKRAMLIAAALLIASPGRPAARADGITEIVENVTLDEEIGIEMLTEDVILDDEPPVTEDGISEAEEEASGENEAGEDAGETDETGDSTAGTDESAEGTGGDTGGQEKQEVVFTPSYGSAYPEQIGGSSYWTTPMDITDEAAVWEMLMEPMVVIDVGKKSSEKVQTYLYLEPDEESKKVGVVTCESQGVRVIEQGEDGWSLIECYSSSFHATKVEAWNLLVHGYIQTKYLKTVKPDQTLGLVVDKLTQRVYVFQNGHLLSTLLCSTGIAMWNGEKYQPYNETRSGEFIMMSRVGTLKSDNLLCEMAIRFNSGDMIHEVPHTNYGDGSANYKRAEAKLGVKSSHGCIRVQRKKTPEGINMTWIWNYAKKHGHIKLVIWEDWQGRQIPIPDSDMLLYYNPKNGSYYHSQETCYMAKNLKFTPFTYGELENETFAELERCPYCTPALRASEIQEINEKYEEGKDHDELLTSLRQGYYEYLKEP